jgi:hypothetical protein
MISNNVCFLIEYMHRQIITINQKPGYNEYIEDVIEIMSKVNPNFNGKICGIDYNMDDMQINTIYVYPFENEYEFCSAEILLIQTKKFITLLNIINKMEDLIENYNGKENQYKVLSQMIAETYVSKYIEISKQITK